MAVVSELVADNDGIDAYAEIIDVFDTWFHNMPLFTEAFMEIRLRSYQPRVNEDVEPAFIVGGGR